MSVSGKLEFIKFIKCGTFAVECVSNSFFHVFSTLIVRFFRQKVKELPTLEEFENMIKKECIFTKEKQFHFLQALFSKMGGRKICQWWPAVLLCSALIINVEQNHPLKWVRIFLSVVYQLRSHLEPCSFTFLNVIFFHQIDAIFP